MKYIGNAGVLSGQLNAPKENAPTQYSDKQFPYFNHVSTRFYQEYAKYASDYIKARAQGLNREDPEKWESVTMRMADLVKESGALQRQFDDYKMVLLDRMKYAYIPRGAKFETMGSTWLCTNPENISGGDGIGVVQRCKAVWNHLDFYGNVVSEPLCVEGTEILRANAPDPQYNMVIAKGYYNVKCQYNKNTAQIDDNTRMILGTACYVVSGFSDFMQEFTGDYDSVRMLEFTVRKDEINPAIDDMENHVAGGKSFDWDISIQGAAVLPVGVSSLFSATSKRNGVTVEDTEEYPITYLWESDNTSVATVDESGTVTGAGDGVCQIICSLEQNPEITETFTVQVSATQTQDVIWFKETPPDSISAYESVTLEAIKYLGVNKTEDGLVPSDTLYPTETLYPSADNPIIWNFYGADPSAYSTEIDGAKVTIRCWNGSIEPLTVSVRSGDMAAETTIKLIGI